MERGEIKQYIDKFEKHIANPRTTPDMREWYHLRVREMKHMLMLKEPERKRKRKHNAIYRARRAGAEIDTAQCSIYRAADSAGAATSPAERILLSEYKFGMQLTIN